MFFNQYPYLNLNDLNLDYILKAIGEMKFEVTNFVSINAIKYADPIQWNITSQYEKNTIVIDPVTGTAYISVAPVPAGVALTRPEYWTVVFDLGSFVTRAAQNFTSHWESETTTTATFPTAMGGWLVWGDVLYKALTNITAGDTYVENGNIEHFTIEDLYNAYLNTIATILNMIGVLDDLVTTDKSSLVNAINEVAAEVLGKIGNLDDLHTTDKTNIVAAINEVADDALGKIGDLDDLNTSDKTSVVNAINEVLGDVENFVTPEQFGAVGDGVADDRDAIVAAIATGKGVYLENEYYIGSTITLSNTTVSIIGSDKAKIIFDATADVFNLTEVHFNCKNVHFDVNGTGTVFKSVSSDFRFDSLTFDGTMYIVDQATSTIADQLITMIVNCKINTTNKGIRFYGNALSRSGRFAMYDTIIASGDLPYFVGECGYAEVYGGDYTATGANASCNLYRCDYATISGGFYHDMERGATIGGGTGKCGTIIGTKNTNMSFSGISVDYATNALDPYSEGKAIVANNIIESNNYGIYLQARKVIVTGNEIYCLNTSSGAKYGIRLNCNEGTPTDHGSIISGNLINCNNSNYTYPIYLAANTIAHVRDNVYMDCAKHMSGSGSCRVIYDEVLEFSESDYVNYDSIYVSDSYGVYICTQLAQNRYIFVPKWNEDDIVSDIGRTFTLINNDTTYNLTVNVKNANTHILANDTDNVLAPSESATLTFLGGGYWLLIKNAVQQTI